MRRSSHPPNSEETSKYDDYAGNGLPLLLYKSMRKMKVVKQGKEIQFQFCVSNRNKHKIIDFDYLFGSAICPKREAKITYPLILKKFAFAKNGCLRMRCLDLLVHVRLGCFGGHAPEEEPSQSGGVLARRFPVIIMSWLSRRKCSI